MTDTGMWNPEAELIRSIQGNVDLNNRVKLIQSLNPLLRDDPQTAFRMAALPISTSDLGVNAFAMGGMMASDQMRVKLDGMTPSMQRMVWGRLPKAQQMALSSQGYGPPQPDDYGFFDFVGDAITKPFEIIGAPLKGLGQATKFAWQPALDTLAWMSDQPAHVYRAIRTMDDGQQWAGLAGAILGVGAAAATIATGGAALGFFAAASTLGAAGLAGATAGSILADPLNPMDFGRAWQQTEDGERAFDRAASRAAEDMLGDPRLMSLATEIADVSQRSIYEMAREVAGARETDAAAQPNSFINELVRIADQIALPNSDQHQRVMQSLQKLLAEPVFLEAVNKLQQGKISIGRDLADNLTKISPMDKDSGLYTLISGGTDALFQIAIDPFLIAGRVNDVAKFRKYGVELIDGAASAASVERVLAISENVPSVVRRHEKIAEAVLLNDVRRARALGVENTELWAQLRTYRANLIEDKVIGPDNFGAEHIRAYLNNVDRMKSVMTGIGTVRGKGQLMIKGFSARNEAYMNIAQTVRSFTSGLTDIRMERQAMRNIAESGDAHIFDPLPEHLKPYVLAETDVPLMEQVVGATDDLGNGRTTWDVLWDHHPSDMHDSFFDLAEKLSHNPYLPDADAQFLDDLKINLVQDVNHINATTFPDLSKRLSEIAGRALQAPRTPNYESFLDQYALYNEINPAARQAGRFIGKMVPGLSHAVGSALQMATTQIPVGGGIALLGPKAPEGMYRFVESMRLLGVPEYMRRMWLDHILANPLGGERAKAMLTALDNGLTVAGVRSLKGGEEFVDNIILRVQHAYGFGGQVDRTLLENGRRVASSPLISDSADMIHLPNLTELRKLTRAGFVSNMVGISDVKVLDAFMNRVWKPSVLLRFAFIPRAAGEEWINFMLRGGFGGLMQEYGGRYVGQYRAWEKVMNKVEKLGVVKIGEGGLTADELALYQRGPLPAFLRPVEAMMNRYHYDGPLYKKMRDFADHLQRFLTPQAMDTTRFALETGTRTRVVAGRGGIGVQGKIDTALAKLGGPIRQGMEIGATTEAAGRQVARRPGTLAQYVPTKEVARLNVSQYADSLLMGSPTSWRRMLAGGLNEDVIKSGEQYALKHRTTLLREVSSTDASNYERGYRRDDLKTLEIPDGKGGTKRMQVVAVRGGWKRHARVNDDPLFAHHVHQGVSHTAVWDVGGVELSRQIASRLLPPTVQRTEIEQFLRRAEDLKDENVMELLIASYANREILRTTLDGMSRPNGGEPILRLLRNRLPQGDTVSIEEMSRQVNALLSKYTEILTRRDGSGYRAWRDDLPNEIRLEMWGPEASQWQDFTNVPKPDAFFNIAEALVSGENQAILGDLTGALANAQRAGIDAFNFYKVNLGHLHSSPDTLLNRQSANVNRALARRERDARRRNVLGERDAAIAADPTDPAAITAFDERMAARPNFVLPDSVAETDRVANEIADQYGELTTNLEGLNAERSQYSPYIDQLEADLSRIESMSAKELAEPLQQMRQDVLDEAARRSQQLTDSFMAATGYMPDTKWIDQLPTRQRVPGTRNGRPAYRWGWRRTTANGNFLPAGGEWDFLKQMSDDDIRFLKRFAQRDVVSKGPDLLVDSYRANARQAGLRLTESMTDDDIMFEIVRIAREREMLTRLANSTPMSRARLLRGTQPKPRVATVVDGKKIRKTGKVAGRAADSAFDELTDLDLAELFSNEGGIEIARQRLLDEARLQTEGKFDRASYYDEQVATLTRQRDQALADLEDLDFHQSRLEQRNVMASFDERLSSLNAEQAAADQARRAAIASGELSRYRFYTTWDEAHDDAISILRSVWTKASNQERAALSMRVMPGGNYAENDTVTLFRPDPSLAIPEEFTNNVWTMSRPIRDGAADRDAREVARTLVDELATAAGKGAQSRILQHREQLVEAFVQEMHMIASRNLQAVARNKEMETFFGLRPVGAAEAFGQTGSVVRLPEGMAASKQINKNDPDWVREMGENLPKHQILLADESLADELNLGMKNLMSRHNQLVAQEPQVYGVRLPRAVASQQSTSIASPLQQQIDIRNATRDASRVVDVASMKADARYAKQPLQSEVRRVATDARTGEPVVWLADPALVRSKQQAVANMQAPDAATEYAQRMYQHYKQMVSKQTREAHVTRMRTAEATLEDGTKQTQEIPRVYRYLDDGRGIAPVEPGELLYDDVKYVTERNDPIRYGASEFMEPAKVTYAENDLMWELIGPMIEDAFDDLRSVLRYRRKDEMLMVRGRLEPSNDWVKAYRSNETHVPSEAYGGPRIALGPEYKILNENLWDRIVRFGFDRVIGPSIDAIVRRPMAFHFFHQRYAIASKMNRWMLDPDLTDRAYQNLSRIFLGNAVADGKQLDEWADVLRRAATVDGLRAEKWTREQALAWGRGHDQTELFPMFRKTQDQIAAKLDDPALTAAEAKMLKQTSVDLTKMERSLLQRTGTPLPPGDRRVALSHEFDATRRFQAASLSETNVDGLVARMEAVLPVGSFNDPERLMRSWNRWVDGEWGAGATGSAGLDLKQAQVVSDYWKHSQHLADQAGSYAAEAALRDIMPFIDSHEIRSQFAEYGKGLLPFWYAEENFLKRWARTIIDDPTVVVKAQLTYAGLRTMGIVRQDEQGRDWFVYPGSGLLVETLSKALPGMGVAAIGTMFQSPTDMMFPGMSDRFGTPSFSPFVSVPLDLTSFMFADLKPIERAVVGDYVANRNALEQLVPTTLVNFWNAGIAALSEDGVDETNSRYSSAMMAAIAHLEATGDGVSAGATAAERDLFLRRVRNHARVILVSQAVAGFFTPGPPQALITGDSGSFSGFGAQDPRDVLNARYQTLIRQLGIDEGTTEFLRLNKDANVFDLVNPLALTVGKTESTSGAPLPTTESAVQFFNDHKDYLQGVPSAGPWLLPTIKQNDTRVQYAFDQQTLEGLRTQLTPEEFLNELKYKEAAPTYFAMKREHLDAIDRMKMAGDDNGVRMENDRWQMASATYRTAHPIFDEEMRNSNATLRRAKILEEMRMVVGDSAAPPSPQLDGLREMMTQWDYYKIALATLREDGSAAGRARVEQAKLTFEKIMDGLLVEQPDLRSFYLAVIRPEANFD